VRYLLVALHLVSAAALPARERDVRVKGATFGLKPDPDAGALDPGGELRKRRFRIVSVS
jgi:hypothetical protein